MKKKVVLAGGTGFIGKYLETQFVNMNYEVILISRNNKHIQWEDMERVVTALDGSEMVINLAGKSVDCRYTETNRKIILGSRTSTTRHIGEAILKCTRPPALWVNASTATIYRHAEDKPMTEKGGQIGTGFSVNVARNGSKISISFSYLIPGELHYEWPLYWERTAV